MAVETWLTDYPMAMGIQQMRIRLMAVGTRCSGDDLDTEATCSYQQKTTKMQRMGIRSMVTSAQWTDSDSKAKANHYIREAWRKGKSLKNASAQRTSSGMMAVLQRTVKLMVGAEHQTTTCLQATSAQ